MKKTFAGIITALLLTAAPAFSQTARQAKQFCQGITKAGAQCSRVAAADNLYCRQHDPKSFKCMGTSKSGDRCKIIVKTNGAYCYIHKAKGN